MPQPTRKIALPLTGPVVHAKVAINRLIRTSWSKDIREANDGDGSGGWFKHVWTFVTRTRRLHARNKTEQTALLGKPPAECAKPGSKTIAPASVWTSAVQMLNLYALLPTKLYATLEQFRVGCA